MSKFKVGDKVKWNDGEHHHDSIRVDKITRIIHDAYGDLRYETEELNPKKDATPKVGLAYERYLVKA